VRPPDQLKERHGIHERPQAEQAHSGKVVRIVHVPHQPPPAAPPEISWESVAKREPGGAQKCSPAERGDADANVTNVLPHREDVPVPVDEHGSPKQTDAERDGQHDGVFGCGEERVRDHALRVQLVREQVEHEEAQVEEAHPQEEELVVVRGRVQVVVVVLVLVHQLLFSRGNRANCLIHWTAYISITIHLYH